MRAVEDILVRLRAFECSGSRYSDTLVLHNDRPDEVSFTPAELDVLKYFPSAVYFSTLDDHNMILSTEYDYDLNGFFPTDGGEDEEDGRCYEVWINGINKYACNSDSVFCACSPNDELTVSVYALSRGEGGEYWSEPRTFTGSMTYGELYDMAGPAFLREVLEHFSDGEEQVDDASARDCEPDHTIMVEMAAEVILNGTTHWRDLCPLAFN